MHKTYENEIVANGENVGEQNGESHIATNATELSESGQASTKDTLPAINSGTILTMLLPTPLNPPTVLIDWPLPPIVSII